MPGLRRGAQDPRGAKRHMERCQYIAPVLEGQIGFFDDTKQDQNEARRG